MHAAESSQMVHGATCRMQHFLKAGCSTLAWLDWWIKAVAQEQWFPEIYGCSNISSDANMRLAGAIEAGTGTDEAGCSETESW